MPSDADPTSLIYQQQYAIRIHEINSAKQLTIPALLQLLQETSMQHLIALKASSWHLEKQNIGWVLLRQQLTRLKPVAYGEYITIVTYPTGFDKFFGYRDYLVLDKDKQLVATSTSKWSLIDKNTRKIAKVPESFQSMSAPPNIKVLKRPETNIKIPVVMAVIARPNIQYYDLDWNQHTNNTVLARHLLGALVSDAVTEQSIRTVTLHYKNESHKNDEIAVHLSPDNRTSTVQLGTKLIAAATIRMTEDED